MRFVLLDRLEVLEPGQCAIAWQRFDPAEELFEDHFPDAPLVPGTLLTEAMAQTGGWLLMVSRGLDAWPLLAMVERAKFRRPVTPGRDLEIRARLPPGTGANGATARIEAEVHHQATVVAQALCVYRFFSAADLGHDGERFRRWTLDQYRHLTRGRDDLPPLG